MCGIAGAYCFGHRRLEASVLKNLLIANEYRGRDATGLAYQSEGGEAVVIKSDDAANKFIRDVSDATWDAAAASPVVLLHTRAQTKGAAKDNANNHPVVGFGWHVVHNGHIANDDDLYHAYNVVRPAEVDTVAIPLVLSRSHTTLLDSVKWLQLLGGTAALAAWNPSLEPLGVVLARVNGNSLYLLYDQPRNILIWSSTELAFKGVSSTALGNLRFSTASSLPDNHAFVLRPGGAQLYTLDRRPFFRTKKPVERRVSVVVSTPAIGTSPPTVTTPRRGAVSYAFEPTNVRAYPFKPVPHFVPEELSWSASSYTTTVAEFRNSKEKSHTVKTAYGAWTFTRAADGIYRYFRPVKSVKKFLRKHWGSVGLPAMLQGEDKTTAFDGVMQLETLRLKERVGTSETSFYEAKGFVCPWCGAYAEHYIWRMSDWRCRFCNIKGVEELSLGVTV